MIERSLVVRLPPVGEAAFPAYDLAQQAAVQEAAGNAGVPVASPVRYEADASFVGAPFVAMPFVDGVIPGEFTPADPWLAGLASDDERRQVWSAFLGAVIDIHAVPHEGLGLRTGLDAELDYWEGYVDWATDGSPPPALADALAWCRANRPAEEPPGGLLWGDVRLGNVIFDPDALAPRAVLDWDMVSVGPIELDLSWFVALDQVTVDLSGMTVAGFGSRDDAIATVESAIDRSLVAFDWFEIYALVRASAASTRLAILFERAGQRSMFKVGQDPTLAAAIARIG